MELQALLVHSKPHYCLNLNKTLWRIGGRLIDVGAAFGGVGRKNLVFRRQTTVSIY